MEIIRLRSEDFEKYKWDILDFLKESSRYSFPDAKLEESYFLEKAERIRKYLIDSSAIIFIALSENHTTGWLWCHEILRLDKKRLHIASIAVKSEYRKCGIGQSLLSYAEEYAKEMKYSGIDLLVTASNQNAVDFYLKHDFFTERLLMKKEI